MAPAIAKKIALGTTQVIWLMSITKVIILNTIKGIGWTSTNRVPLKLPIDIVLETSMIIRLNSILIVILQSNRRSFHPPSIIGLCITTLDVVIIEEIASLKAGKVVSLSTT